MTFKTTFHGDANALAPTRKRLDERVELVVLAAGIDVGRQLFEEPLVEAHSGPGGGEVRRRDRADASRQTETEHLTHMRSRVPAPQREHRLQAGPMQELNPPTTPSRRGQVAERYESGPLQPKRGANRPHRVVVARRIVSRIDLDRPEGQSDCRRLLRKQFPPHTVQPRTAVLFRHCGQKPPHVPLRIGPKKLQHPRRVLSRGPPHPDRPAPRGGPVARRKLPRGGIREWSGSVRCLTVSVLQERRGTP